MGSKQKSVMGKSISPKTLKQKTIMNKSNSGKSEKQKASVMGKSISPIKALSKDGNGEKATPSFYSLRAIDIVHRAEGDFGTIVKSDREDDESPYYTLEPLNVDKADSKVNYYRRLLYWNIGLTIFCVALWLLFMSLFTWFFFYSTEKYYVPHGPSGVPDLNDKCGEFVSRYSKYSSYFPDQDCAYHPFRYPENCHTLVCGITYVAANEHLSDDSTSADIGKVKFSTILNLTFNFSMPNFAPCSPTGWCFKGQCLNVNDDRIKKYARDSARPVDGKWQNSKCGSMKCIVWFPTNRVPMLFDSNGTGNANGYCINNIGNDQISVECQTVRTSHYKFVPNLQPNFGFQSCSKPQYGGQLCWDDDPNNDFYELRDILFLYETCLCSNTMENSTEQILHPDCNLDLANQCQLKCEDNLTKKIEYHQLAVGWSCSSRQSETMNSIYGSCFYGQCVIKLENFNESCAIAHNGSKARHEKMKPDSM